MATINGRLMYDWYRSTIASASLEGIANVPIVLQNLSTKETLAVYTDSGGNYSFINVPNGNYQMVEYYGYNGVLTTPGDFRNATIKDLLTTAVTPPISYIPSPASGSTHLDCTSPNTLLITVNNTDIDNYILNGPVKYIPIEEVMDHNVTILDPNLITIAQNGTFGFYSPGTASYTFATSTYQGVGEGFGFVSRVPKDGEYTIENITSATASGYTWWAFADHTTGNETGRSMVINGDNPGGLIFNETITVKPNTYYLFTAWILNMIKRSGYQAPALGVRIIDGNGEVLVDRTLGQEIPANRYIPEWVQIGSVIQSGNNTSITVQFVSQGPSAIGNDYALDDVVVKEVDINSVSIPLLKEISTTYAQVNEIVTYTLSFKNTYDFEMTNLKFKDIIPFGLKFIEGSVTINGITEASFNPNVGFSLPDIISGKTVVIAFKALVTSIPDVNPTINMGELSYDYTFIKGSIPSSFIINSNEVPLNIKSEADLAIIKKVLNESVMSGDEIKYLLTVRNYGPSDAINIKITDNIPNELTKAEYSLDNTYWYSWNGTYSVSTLKKDETFNIYIKGLVSDTAQTIVNKATVYSDTFDPDLTNNESTTNTIVSSSADLDIIKKVLNERVIKGEEIKYLLTIRNYGPSNAINVLITDNIPNDIKNVEYSLDNTNWYPWNKTYSIAILRNDETLNIYIKGIVSDTAQTIINKATVYSDTFDPDLTNNESTTNTIVTTISADLSVVKTACPIKAQPCEEITYTIIVSNAGPSEAINVILNDEISKMIFDAKYSVDNGRTWHRWNGSISLGNMSANTNKIILISGCVNECAHGEIKNIVKVSSSTFDQNLNNNTYTLTTKIDCSC